jgi:hypothetical protein
MWAIARCTAGQRSLPLRVRSAARAAQAKVSSLQAGATPLRAASAQALR